MIYFHSVPSHGNPVLAAGTANIIPTEEGFQGDSMDDVSGHFQPPGILVNIGREAFARIGIYFSRVNSTGR